MKTYPISLRRADWRFLLPAPQSQQFEELVMLGAPAELVERMRATEFAAEVGDQLQGENTADAIAVLDGARSSIHAAVHCLKPDGVLYYETRGRGARQRLEQMLRAVGFETHAYLALPNFVQCKKYLPLDAPNVLEWYWQTLYMAGTLPQRALLSVLPRVTRAQPRLLEWLAPCVALVATRGESARRFCEWSSFDETSLQGARCESARRFTETSLQGARHTNTLLLTSGQDESSRVVLFPFAANDAEPRAVIKISTRADFDALTMREQQTLADLRARLDERLRDTLPQPLGAVCVNGHAAGVESYARGRSLWASSGDWQRTSQRAVDDLTLATNWLCAFQQQVGTRVEWNRAAIGRWVEQPLKNYCFLFGETERARDLFARARERAEELLGATMLQVVQHNDFGPWNFARAGDRLIVMDWESAACGLGVGDLFYFVTHWSFITRRLYGEHTELRGVYELFIERAPQDERVRAARQRMSAYLEKMELDPRFAPLLLVTFWVDRALDRFTRQGALGAQGVNENRFAQYVALLAKHGETLFAGAAFLQNDFQVHPFPVFSKLAPISLHAGTSVRPTR